MELFILIVVLGLLLIVVLLYNSLVGRRNRVDQAFSSIDAYLRKRVDLIPNLVAAVQQYMTHERQLLEQITALRARAMAGPGSIDEQVRLQNELGAVLGRIMAVAEQYPDLKASQNFLQLQAALNEVEEQISAARRAYNAAVTDYNNAVQMFPSSIIAGMANFQPRPWFEIPEAERQNVDVAALFRR